MLEKPIGSHLLKAWFLRKKQTRKKPSFAVSMVSTPNAAKKTRFHTWCQAQSLPLPNPCWARWGRGYLPLASLRSSDRAEIRTWSETGNTKLCHIRDCAQLLIGESTKNATWFHIDGQDEGRIERVSFVRWTASELMKLEQHIFEFCMCCHRIIAFSFLFFSFQGCTSNNTKIAQFG